MKTNKNLTIGIMLIFLEVLLLTSLLLFTQQEVFAEVGSPNATIITEFEVGNSFPEIRNITINGDVAIALTPNSTKIVECAAIVVDYNGDTDIDSGNATFFDSSIAEADPDDNNNHYLNSSCEINKSFVSFNGISDDPYNALINCTFRLYYYANPGDWNCTIKVNDTKGSAATESDKQTVSELLALGLPDEIDYGTVNATYASGEQTTNITNYGNIEINLSLEGYGAFPGDGNAMNCTLGAVGNISVEYEKYNLTASNPGTLSLSELEATHTNLTTTAETKKFNLAARTNDTVNKAIKQSYWRIYVPTGVAGTCTGNIIFGATTAAGS